MAIQTIGGYVEDPQAPNQIATSPGFSTTQMNMTANNHKAAPYIFRATETCNIRYVGFATRTVTTGGPVTARLETVDAATGMPTGTLVAASTEVAVTINSADDNVYFEATLTADAAVTAGSMYALVLVNDPTTPGSMQISAFADDQAHHPYSAFHNGTSWAMVANMACVGSLRKDTGAVMFVPGLYPYSGTSTRTFNSSTNPNHAALRQRRPYPVQCAGFWAWWDLDGDCQVLLVNEAWDGTDGNALAHLTIDKDIESVTSGGVHLHYWATPVQLAKNTWYRLVFKPTTTTSLALYEMLTLNATVMGAMAYGTESHLSTANNPNDDTDWTNTTSQRPFAGLLLNGFDDGVGGGSTTNIFVIAD